MSTLPVFQEIDEGASARKMIARKLREVVKKPCRRVLLINPPQIEEDQFFLDLALRNRYWNYPPYGPGVLCRNLEMRGFTTELLDLNFEVLNSAHELKDNFNYRVWRGKLRTALDEFRPDLVAMSCMFTMTHPIVKQIVQAVKDHDPQLPIIAGGVHVSNATKLVLEDCPEIDFGGLYEADQSFPDMLDVANGTLEEDRLTQVATFVDGKYVEVRARATPSEGSIQVSPLYHNLPIGKYEAIGQVGSYRHMHEGRLASSVLRARGCRARCSFCSVSTFNGRGVRERNYLNVADEIQSLADNYGIKHISFLDDDLLSNPKDLIMLFNEIVRRKLNITWDATNGLIAAFITAELMDAMVASGCIGFNLGIESGNPQILREVHKPGTVESFRKCMALVSKYPQVFVKAFLMIGFPNETLRMILDTVNLCLELHFDWCSLQILNPLPSTEIYNAMLEQGLIKNDLQTSNVAFFNGPHGKQKLVQERQRLSAEDFFDLFRVCDMDSIPPKETLGDYWFLIDYKVNYEQLLGISDPVKLTKIQGILSDIRHRIAPENPMGWLFAGIIEQKLGRPGIARTMVPIAEKLLHGSAYWQKRFETLGLNDLLGRLHRETSV